MVANDFGRISDKNRLSLLKIFTSKLWFVASNNKGSESKLTDTHFFFSLSYFS